MDFKSIQSLGSLTNRVIEIQQLIDVVNHLAIRALEEEESFLVVNLGFSSKIDVTKAIDDYLYEIFSNVSVSPSYPTLENIRTEVARIKYGGKYQMIVFEALISAMKQELSEVSAAIKSKTSNL